MLPSEVSVMYTKVNLTMLSLSGPSVRMKRRPNPWVNQTKK